MRRRKRLRADPDKVREFQQRGRGSLGRKPLRRERSAPRRRKARRKARFGPEARQRVYARSGGSCVRPCCGRRVAHLHHWLPQEKFPEAAQDEDNVSGTCPWCNWDHHWAPDGRLPFEAIPSCALRLAAELGDRATAYLERTYPREGPTPGGTRQEDGG